MTNYPSNYRHFVVADHHFLASLVIVTFSYLLHCNTSLFIFASEPVNHITCGSVIKLENEAKPEVRLHSHDIKYGSGSGQQSVTAVENQDTNSYWSILGEKNKYCNRGEPIECGSTIRLQHVQTRKFLHSHLFKSPLSSQQEVSAFGNDSDSDTGDHWMVYCRSRYWQKNESIRLKHVDTGMWLSLSGNIYGRPIFGQLEVICSTNPESSSNWKTAEGVYVQPTSTSETILKHDELALNILTATRRCLSSSIKKFILPDIGEGIKEVEVRNWQVKVGDQVKEFDPICDVESDKATATISSRYEGRVTKIYYEVGETAVVGEPLVDIELKEAPSEDTSQKGNTSNIDTSKNQSTSKVDIPEQKSGPVIATLPSVRQMAKQRGIDLVKVTPTGKYGHVLKDDLLKYIENLQSGKVEPPLPSPSPFKETLSEAQSETRKPLRGIRKAMLKTMTSSLAIPHCPYIEKIDLTRLDETSARHKIGKFPIIIKMVSLALSEYPQLNASLDQNGEPSLILKRNHNIGIAIDTEFGLVVPNIKNVQTLTIVEITNELSRLRELAYASKLSVSDSTGGTVTLSNIGAIGSGMGIPTILPPEILIGALGRAEKHPVLNSDGQWEARNVMSLVWSVDHRVVDGATLARFSKLLKMFLEEPDSSLLKLK